MTSSKYQTPEDIYLFFKTQNAFERLIKHHQLVAETAKEILAGIQNIFPNLDCNYSEVLVGSAIHDAGKIIFEREINNSGKQHELAGEQYLIDLGIPSHIARFSRTHARWQDPDCTIEDLLVALADTLWKGSRNNRLENFIVKSIADSLQIDFWDIFIKLDSLFEQISDRGNERLSRSV